MITIKCSQKLALTCPRLLRYQQPQLLLVSSSAEYHRSYSSSLSRCSSPSSSFNTRPRYFGLQSRSNHLKASRSYATVADNNNNNEDKKVPDNSEPEIEHDPELVKLLQSYPTSKNTTPYQILGFNGEKGFSKKLLKKRFYKLAKIYHPDSQTYVGFSLNKKKFFTTNEDEILTVALKEARFKKVLAAYTLLRKDRTKINYDKYGVGWEDNSSSYLRSYENMNQKHANGATGTWEDYHKAKYEQSYGFTGDRTWRHVDPNSSLYEQFEKNRKNIFLSLLLTTLVYGALQTAHIVLYDDYIGGRYNTSLVASLEMHEKSEQDLKDAYNNFHMGGTKDERVQRFLWFRFLGQLLKVGDLNEMLGYMRREKILKDSKPEEEQGKLLKFDICSSKQSESKPKPTHATPVQIPAPISH